MVLVMDRLRMTYNREIVIVVVVVVSVSLSRLVRKVAGRGVFPPEPSSLVLLQCQSSISSSRTKI